MQFDSKLYRKSITFSQIWKSILLFSVSYLLFEIFYDDINAVLVRKVISHFPSNFITDVLCFIFSIYVMIKLGKALKNSLVPTLASLTFSVLSIVFYITLIRFNYFYQFYTFKIKAFQLINYADFLFFHSCILILDFKVFNKKLQKNNFTSLISDEANPNNIHDLLESESYVQRIATAINETTGNVAYGIGVFSSWGSGKTDFLLRLKKTLDLNPSENIVLEFNPWKSASTEGVLEDFFSTLSSGLRQYNKSLTKELRGYSKKILSTQEDIRFRLLDSFMEILVEDHTLLERYNYINSSIKKTGKRLIIFIDDLDRMAGIEVMQVLRIIRNSANFANTFFIVALDHEYIVNVLHKTGHFSKEEEYLKKVFQLIIPLPKIRKDTFSSEILNLLGTKEMSLEDKDKIEKAVSLLKFNSLPASLFGPVSSKEEGHLEKMLDNYRDLKRFCNSFKINFNILKDEVEIIDLFLLELIKTKSFYAYELISNKTLLSISPQEPYVYVLSNEGWEFYSKSLKLDDYHLGSIKDALNYLLEMSNVKGTRKFALPYNFYLYFSFQLFSLISLEEFRDTVKQIPRVMRNRFNKWILEGKQGDLSRILDNYSEYKDKGEFEKFLRAFILGKETGDFISRAKAMIMAVDKNSTTYFKGKSEYSEFVRSILKDNSLPEFNRAEIANELLKHSIYNLSDLILSKEELQKIIYDLFDKYLSHKDLYDDEVNSFYLFNDDRRVDSFIFLTPNAHKRLYEFLAIPKNFDEYLRYLIRSRSLPTQGEFVFAPFTEEIFKGWKNFKKIVQRHETSDKQIKKLMAIILKNVDRFIEGEDRFLLEGEDLEFVLKHLQSTKQYYF